MCINAKWTVKKMREWLNHPERKGDYIIAYKVVEKQKNKNGKEYLMPPFYYFPRAITRGESHKYKRKNRCVSRQTLDEIRKNRVFYAISHKRTNYIAYFHLCAKYDDAEYWAKWSNRPMIVECKVPKKAITAIGMQKGRMVIVTKQFEIIDPKAEKYF